MKRIFFFALVASLVLPSCRFVEGKQIKGDGNMAKDQRTISGFTGVETHGSIDIVVIPGDYKVTVESDRNILPYIVTEVVNNELIVHFKDDFHGYSYTSATVYITAPALNVFKTQGSGNITSNGKFNGTAKTEITVGGSGDIKLDLNTPVIDAEISGSGNITLSGETKDFSSEINGSGDIKAYDLKAEMVRTSVHGSGDTNVSASVKLDAEIFGSGDVHYKGAPQVSSSIHGSGAVGQVN
jgi:Putative auto-transporter adhesin, head GIN domain